MLDVTQAIEQVHTEHCVWDRLCWVVRDGFLEEEGSLEIDLR